MLRVEQHAGIDALAREWDDLADRVGAVPFLRPGWVEAWCEAFPRRSLRIYAVWSGERLAGVVPLLVRRGALVSPTNWHTPVFGALCEDSATSRALVDAIFEARPRQVTLRFIDSDDRTIDALRDQTASAGYSLAQRVMMRSPYVPLDGGWTAYEKLLTSKRRSNLRRLERRLREEGELSFEVLDGRERLEQLLREGFEVEASSWKGSRGTAILSRPNSVAFYRSVAQWAASQRMLRLGYLRLGGRAIAFDFCLEDDRSHYLLKTGYHVAHRSSAPGVVLRRMMLERAFESGLATYEFLGGDQDWKSEWTDRSRDRLALHAFSATFVGRLDRATFKYVRPLARGLLRALSR
jgi:CelD/BcsL family acetyltransferase involved in cellulose biosynthesis